MIHYAFNFCQTVEDSQDVDENLIEATERISKAMDTTVLLKTRDSLRDLANLVESILIERT